MTEAVSSIKGEYIKLRAITDRWMTLGSRTLADGTICIGHIPHVAPEAWLHRLMPPLDSGDLVKLQDKIGIEFPSDLQLLLMIHNGMVLFEGLISVYGLRISYQRSNIEAMLGQPYDMISPNNRERPETVPDDLLFFGSLGDDHDRVAMWPDGSVSIWWKSKRELSKRVYGSLFEFLLTESEKADRRFDQRGRDTKSPAKIN